MNYDLLVVVVDDTSDYVVNAQSFCELLSKQYAHNASVIVLIFVGASFNRAIAGQKLSEIKYPSFQDGNGKYDFKNVSLWIKEAKLNIDFDKPEAVSTALIVDVKQGHKQYKGLISSADGDILFYDRKGKSFGQLSTSGHKNPQLIKLFDAVGMFSSLTQSQSIEFIKKLMPFYNGDESAAKREFDSFCSASGIKIEASVPTTPVHTSGNSSGQIVQAPPTPQTQPVIPVPQPIPQPAKTQSSSRSTNNIIIKLTKWFKNLSTQAKVAMITVGFMTVVLLFYINSVASDNMVYINGGTFMMGEGPQQQVTVSGFHLGKYEVTQKEYQKIMGTNPSYFKGNKLPVEQVSWYDAIEYCNRLSQRKGLTPAYTINGTNVIWNRNTNGYRLPTEAEWEYACRAGTTTLFSTGNTITSLQANFWGNNVERTTPVGNYAPNAWGLYDMHGNVREWCWDWFGTYPSSSETNPAGASSGTDRVVRGGGWYDGARYVRSASRYYLNPTGRNALIGFRLVRP